MLDSTWPDSPPTLSALSGPGELRDSEWRQVAILCVTIHDLAPIADRSGRTDIPEHLARAGLVMKEILTSYGGVAGLPVQRSERGEGILVTGVFGGQTASENDAERAVRSALAMYERLQAFNRDLLASHIHLEMQIGIHFGWVTTFSDGTVEVQENAITVARGLAMAAPAEHLLITAEVHTLLADLFHYEGLGNIFINGHEGPIPAYRVVGVNARVEGRWQRSRLVRRSQMVGREAELELLQQTYAESSDPDRWEWISCGDRRSIRPVLVAISGSEGSGKSRLLYEFRRVTPPFREGMLSPLVGRAASIFPVPYAIFSELLKNLFGIRATDPAVARRRKLDAGLPAFMTFEPELQTSTPLLHYLVGVELGEVAQSARNFQLELRMAFLRLLRAVARQCFEVRGHPLLVYLEDLHGIHDRSQSALTAVLERLDSPVPMVIFATHRPGYKVPCEVRQATRYRELVLKPLTQEGQRQVIRSMLEGADFPPALEARILEKASGNPYYLEELIRSLVEDRVLVFRMGSWQVDRAVEDVLLPATLGSLLLSRIDMLDKPARELLLRAAVVGEVVYPGVLEDIQGELQGFPVTPLLKQLEESRLLRQTELYGEVSYVFENPLVREVSYQTLVPHNRVVLHRLVGRAIEQRFVASLSDHYLEIANHLRLGEEPTRAASYFRLAGEKAQDEYANELALSCYTTCLNLSTDTSECRHVRWRMARVLRMLGRADEASSVLETLAAELVPPLDGTYDFLAEIVLELSRVRRNIGQLRQAVDLATRALELFGKAEDQEGQAEAYIALGKCHRLLGDLDAAQGAYEKSLEVLRSLENRFAEGRVFSNLGRLALDRGQLELAGIHFRDALERQQAAHDRWGIALECGHLGEVAYAAGDLTAAEDHFRSCLSQAEPLEIRPLMAGSRMYLGAISARRGEMKEGLDDLEAGIRIAVSLQDLPRQVRGYDLKAEALEVLELWKEAQIARQEAQRLAELAGMRSQVLAEIFER